MTRLYSSAAAARKKYPPSLLIVEAPDYVFEGWGYDPSQEGDARFLPPIPPEGWLYDENTGTFYQDGEVPPSLRPSEEEQLRADIDYLAIMMGVSL